MNKLLAGIQIEITIEDLATGGLGVGRHEGFVVFVKGAIPQERVKATITKKKKSHAEATLDEVLLSSPDRTNPECPLVGTCGGCTLRHVAYDAQLRWKRKQITDTVERIGKQENIEVLPVIPSPKIRHYRNKMEYTFSMNDAGEPIVGFHYPGTFDHIFEVKSCLLQPKSFDEMLAAVTHYARKHHLTTYHQRRHEGFLRHAIMRHSATTNECMLILLTQDGDLPEKEAFAQTLKEQITGFKGLVWGINRSVADVARIDEEAWRWGEPELFETLNQLTFSISPQSFFQTNTAGAEILYAKVIELARLDKNAVLFDAYCGAGTIGLHSASKAKTVVGVEVIKEAIWDARENALRNGIDNTTFIVSPMERGFELAAHAVGGIPSENPFSHVVIDPPRGGMDKKSLTGLIALRAPIFVYVSCNPATLARDLQLICDSGYRIETVQPIDMFPYTNHVETIVLMSKK